MNAKSSLRLALSALALVAPALAFGQSPGVVGLWKTAGDEGLIRIEACGVEICGHIANTPQPGDTQIQTDVRNPDPALRDRPIDGLQILKLKPLGPSRWGDGYIYNPEDGRHYRASIDLAPDGRLRLRGCLIAPLCRTQTWTRAGRLAERGAVRPSPPS